MRKTGWGGVMAMAMMLPGAAWAQVDGGSAGQAPPPAVQGPPQRPAPGNHHRMATMRPLQPPQPGQAGAAGDAGGQGQNAASGESAGQGQTAAGMRSEDVLARMVKQAGVIFAGEVYAIRMPTGEQNQGTKGGQHSEHADTVEVEFGVQQGIRGAVIGDPYVLRERMSDWQSHPGLFKLHGRYVVLLEKPDAAGLSRTVEGEHGVLPIDGNNNVDLARLRALAGGAARQARLTGNNPGGPGEFGGAGARCGPAERDGAVSPAGGAQNGAGAEQATGAGQQNGAGAEQGSGAGLQAGPKVPDVTTANGEETLVSGTDRGRMPELEAASIPYLALMRDLYVLTAAETNGLEPPNGQKSPGGAGGNQP